MIAAPVGSARRMASLDERYQNDCSTGLRCGSGRPSTRRSSRRTPIESSRGPSSLIAAGVTTTAAAAAKATTATPAYANDFRKYCGNSTMVIIDRATVIAENSTVRPAVAIVLIKASSRSAPSASSSRYRLRINNM
jgi:hypothetical protein